MSKTNRGPSRSQALPPRSVHWAVAFIERSRESASRKSAAAATPEVSAPLDQSSIDPPVGIRRGEQTGSRFRTDRVFNSDGRWYISTREGINVGPYWSAKEARADAARLANLLESVSREGREDVSLAIRRFGSRVR